MLCKDRVFETFRSLYTQRPTQSSVLRRSLGFNDEVTEYAHISYMASRDNTMLVQPRDRRTYPWVSYANCNQIIFNKFKLLAVKLQAEKFLTQMLSRCLYSFLLFFQGERACSCKEDGCQCLINVSGLNLTIER